MRVDRTPDDMKSTDSIAPLSSKSTSEAKIEAPKASDLPKEGGTQTGLEKVKNNAKELAKQKLPTALDNCCKAMNKEGSLYFTADAGSGNTLEITSIIGQLFKEPRGKSE